MSEASWGLMGRDVIGSSRRMRSLGLTATIRNFNDAAVPGLGGLSYGKQLLWSLLGIHTASMARGQGMPVSKTEVANAIEAMACIIALETPAVAPERIRGQQKLQGKRPCPFSEARKPTFYVSQPMRMGLVQPLLQLNLVEQGSTRFNAYTLSSQGYTFLELACAPYSTAYINKGIQKALLEWVLGKIEPWSAKPLRDCLNPAKPLPKDARILLRGLLDDNPRRRDALLWMQNIVEKPQELSWSKKPDQLTEEHWHDIHAGALLFAARDAAIATLEAVEKQLDKIESAILPLREVAASSALDSLRLAAQIFLDTGNKDADAVSFCSNCIQKDAITVLRYLIELDGRVLLLVEDSVVPGEAFVKGIGNTNSPSDTSEKQSTGDSSTAADTVENIFDALPDISQRIRNLLRIYRDLQGAAQEKAQ